MAALLVAFFHLRFGTVGIPWFDHYVFSFRFGSRGYLWVDFFFILSGFILTYRYRDLCKKLTVRVYGYFVWQRFARIWPLHFVTLGIALIYLGLKHGSGYLSRNAIIANLLLIHGWGHYFHPPLNFPSWSLSSEWGAYLVLPAYLFAIGSLRRSAIHIPLLMGCYALLIWYAAAFGHGTLDRLREQWGLGRCLIQVGIGVSLFQLHEWLARESSARFGRRTSAVARIFDAAAAVVFVAIFVVFTYTIWDLYFVPLAAALIFCLSLAEGPFTKLLKWRPMILFGEISFSIYMWHGFVLWLCQDIPLTFKAKLGFGTGALLLLAAHLLVIGLAYLTYRWIERPAHRVLTGHRLFPVPATSS